MGRGAWTDSAIPSVRQRTNPATDRGGLTLDPQGHIQGHIQGPGRANERASSTTKPEMTTRPARGKLTGGHSPCVGLTGGLVILNPR